jgi:hypothetical protein
MEPNVDGVGECSQPYAGISSANWKNSGLPSKAPWRRSASPVSGPIVLLALGAASTGLSSSPSPTKAAAVAGMCPQKWRHSCNRLCATARPSKPCFTNWGLNCCGNTAGSGTPRPKLNLTKTPRLSYFAKEPPTSSARSREPWTSWPRMRRATRTNCFSTHLEIGRKSAIAEALPKRSISIDKMTWHVKMKADSHLRMVCQGLIGDV